MLTRLQLDERRARFEERQEAEAIARLTRERENNARLKKALGGWLSTLTRWDTFSTWTFSKPITEKGAMYWSRRHLQWIEEMAGQPIYAFYAVDRGTCGGLLHVHALVGNVGHLKPYCGHRLAPGTWGRYTCCLLHAWPCGYARVYPYDPNKGAVHYVAKYITKKLSEWELYGFPAHPQNILDRTVPLEV